MKKVITWRELYARALRGLPRRNLKMPRRVEPGMYVAEGGPFDGRTLLLTDGTSARLRVGQQRGIYRCAMVARAGRFGGTAKWVAQ